MLIVAGEIVVEAGAIESVREALRAHLQMPHMAEFGAAVATVQPKSVSVQAYEIAQEVPLPR